MSATTIISVVGLFFAAIAAWGAWMTVRLTRQIRQEERLRALISAILTVGYAAEDMVAQEPNSRERFRDSRRELMRTSALGFTAPGTIEDFRELKGLLDSLTTEEAWKRLDELPDNATKAATILSKKHPLSRTERVWTKVYWAAKYARHPCSWSRITELRRGWGTHDSD